MRSGLRAMASAWLRLPAVVRSLAPVGVMAVLWLSSSQQPTSAGATVLGAFLHNGAHVVAWFGLSAAWLLTLLSSASGLSERLPRWPAWTAVILSVGYGIVDELHQSFVPGRDCSAWDVASDACGSLIAVAFVWWTFTGERRFAWRTAGLCAVALVSVSCSTWLIA